MFSYGTKPSPHDNWQCPCVCLYGKYDTSGVSVGKWLLPSVLFWWPEYILANDCNFIVFLKIIGIMRHARCHFQVECCSSLYQYLIYKVFRGHFPVKIAQNILSIFLSTRNDSDCILAISILIKVNYMQFSNKILK